MNTNDLSKTLHEIEFLHDINPAHLEKLGNIAQVCHFDVQDVVFREGEPAEKVYLVVSGSVALQVCAGNTGTKHIVDVGPGELLGWSSLTCKPRFAATAIASKRTHMIQIDGRQLRAICESDPKFGYEFMRRTMLALAKRLRVTWTQLAELYLSHYVPMSAGVSAQND
jgi:CRP-like cAMP-binding protein